MRVAQVLRVKQDKHLTIDRFVCDGRIQIKAYLAARWCMGSMYLVANLDYSVHRLDYVKYDLSKHVCYLHDNYV